MTRPLTERELSVLEALLSVEFEDAGELRRQAPAAVVARMCGCGCPSIDFELPVAERGMHIRVNAGVRGTNDGMFLYTVGPWLGGVEWVGVSENDPSEFPEPSLLDIEVADPSLGGG